MAVDAAAVEDGEQELRLLLRGGGEDARARRLRQQGALGLAVATGDRGVPQHGGLEAAVAEAEGVAVVAGRRRAIDGAHRVELRGIAGEGRIAARSAVVDGDGG